MDITSNLQSFAGSFLCKLSIVGETGAQAGVAGVPKAQTVRRVYLPNGSKPALSMLVSDINENSKDLR